MKNLNEDILKLKFIKHTYADVKDVVNEIVNLLQESYTRVLTFKTSESDEDETLVDTLMWSTYNKGKVVNKHGLDMLLFSSKHDEDDLYIKWVFKRVQSDLFCSGLCKVKDGEVTKPSKVSLTYLGRETTLEVLD